MDSKDLKLTKKDIGTMIVVAVALALVAFVFIKLYADRNRTLDNEGENTTVYLYSQVNDEGKIEFYTMIEEYTDSGLHASVHYTTTTTTGPSTSETASETTTQPAPVYVTDANGEKVTDAEGKFVTEKPTTTQKPETSVQIQTDAKGEVLTDAKGKPVTQIVTKPAATETTTADIWTEVTTTNRLGIETNYSVESGTASTIISEINRKREEGGLPALKTVGGLNTAAKASAMAGALPDYSGGGSAYFTTKTSSGGAAIYNELISSTDITSTEAYKNIGVGVIKYKGQYYTAVVLS